MIKLTLRTNKLGDGSETFDVIISDIHNGELDGQVVLHAHDERRAEQLIEMMRLVMVEYTNDTVATEPEAWLAVAPNQRHRR
jgi:hypothetical protein